MCLLLATVFWLQLSNFKYVHHTGRVVTYLWFGNTLQGDGRGVPGINNPVTNFKLINGTHLKSKYSNFGNWRTMSATECHVRNNDAVNSNTARLMNGANSPGLLIFEFGNDTVVSNLLCLHRKKSNKK